MKTNEIIKALRCCASDTNDGCEGCPLDDAQPYDPRCIREMATAVADEIEMLIDRCARYAEEILVLQERSRWIPVTERLPEAGARVIVARGDKTEQGVYLGINGWWKVYGTNTKKVTHWMPLPAGPEVE